MRESGPDILAFASGFSRFAGPNNPILDLGNYLVRDLGISFALVSTAQPPDPDFARHVAFPVFRALLGDSSRASERLSIGPANVLRAGKVISRLRPRRIIVFSSLDTAFEVAAAVREPVPLGQNVLLQVLPGTSAAGLEQPLSHWQRPRISARRTLDRLASKTIVRGILAHSVFHRRLYEDVGVPADRIRIVPHCIDLARLHATPSEPPLERSQRATATLLCVSRLEPEKGIRELLAAIQEASRQVPLHLQLAGEGSLKGEVEGVRQAHFKTKDFGLELLPWMPLEDLLGFMRGADAIVVPSHYEPFGMVALEAMALGKAIIATKHGGVAELIRHRKDGLLVNPLETTEFARTLVELTQNEALRRRLGESAQERARSQYAVQVVAPMFLDAMEAFG